MDDYHHRCMQLPEISKGDEQVSRRTCLKLMLVGTVGLATGKAVNALLAAENEGKVVVLTDDNWSAEVLQSKIPVLVDFSAKWCGPCRQMKPTCKTIAKEFEKRAKVGELDIDENEVDSNHHVEALPTFVLFKNGKEFERSVGMQTEEALRAMINRALKE